MTCAEHEGVEGGGGGGGGGEDGGERDNGRGIGGEELRVVTGARGVWRRW